jgi:hypothetical protein
MTRKRVLLVALFALLALPIANADAGWRVGIAVGPGPYYPRPYYPYGVYVAPVPVVVAPAPVYVQPAPVYVQPAPVYVQPGPVAGYTQATPAGPAVVTVPPPGLPAQPIPVR